MNRLVEHQQRDYEVGESLHAVLRALRSQIRRVIG
jgi:hypothetical protein